MLRQEVPPLNIAVIGTGIAGLSAAWLLQKKHRVTVYEKNDWIGGHSNTVDAPTPAGRTPVDTGFIVYNERNYPNLTALFDHLEVPTKESDMSFSASLNGGAFEYSGTDLNGFLGQRSNIFRPRFWVMLRDVLRFYRESPAFLQRNDAADMPLRVFLRDRRYSESFVRDHLLPMGAAIWSTTVDQMLDYPTAAFIRFFESHGLLSIGNRPRWRTVDGGSREYVVRLAAPFRSNIVARGATAIRRSPNGVQVLDSSGATERYDHVVIATHANEALQLLDAPDPFETGLLGAWRYTVNRAVLHRSADFMPRRRRIWSSWNFISDAGQDSDTALCVTYWMNRLQGLNPNDNLFVTLNPPREPPAGSTIREFVYTHPYYDAAALAAQHDLWSLQGHRRCWYCGSYFGYGFHEDALQSGLAVAEQLGGVRRPWTVENENGRIPVIHPERTLAA